MGADHEVWPAGIPRRIPASGTCVCDILDLEREGVVEPLAGRVPGGKGPGIQHLLRALLLDKSLGAHVPARILRDR